LELGTSSAKGSAKVHYVNLLRTLLCQRLFGFEKESDSKGKADNERRNLQPKKRIKNILEEERLEMDRVTKVLKVEFRADCNCKCAFKSKYTGTSKTICFKQGV